MPTDQTKEQPKKSAAEAAPKPTRRTFVRRGYFALAPLMMLASSVGGGSASAATLGTVVSIPGQLSDIAIDSSRGVLYAANFFANRVEVVSLPSRTLQTPIVVQRQPTSLALSPDGRYLVIGHQTGITLLDLNANTQQFQPVGTVFAVAFAGTCPADFGGIGPAAMVIRHNGLPVDGLHVDLLCPAVSPLQLKTLDAYTVASVPLPAGWYNTPPQYVQASSGVSGDGKVAYAVVQTGTPTPVLFRYDSSQMDAAGNLVPGALRPVAFSASPTLGPTVVSVDQTGATLVAGWALIGWNGTRSFNVGFDLVDLAQFPGAAGALSWGGHAFDWSRNLIYAQVPVNTQQTANASASAPHQLQVVDSDNLTVREVYQLRENLAGKALISGDNMYAISDSGLTILPLRNLAGVHRVKALQEDLLFQASGCNQGVVSQYLDIVDPSGGATDFTLSVNSPGIKLSSLTGTTPARVQVLVDPTAFQSQKGTTTFSLQIASSQAVNVPAPVRLLINTRDPDQQGVLYNVPGTIVDVLADPARNQFYAIRQDKNQVLVFDGTTFNQIAALRTGNTPVQMAIFHDSLNSDWLLVTNDNSQLINVFDLRTLKPASPIGLMSGYYARSIAVSNYSKILVTTTTHAGATSGTSQVLNINLPFGFTAPADIGIYPNDIDVDSVLVASPSGRMIFNPRPDGGVALYDAQADAFIASRKSLSSLSGAYAALSDGIFMAGNQMFNSAMVNMGQLDMQGGVSSGSTAVDGAGMLSMAPSAGANGALERFSMNQFNSISPMRMAETPTTAQTLLAIPAGLAGQTILPFTRTLAPLSNRQSIVQLSTSGFMVLPWAFDAARQTPVINAITNAADPNSAVAPGTLVSIWGSGLSDGNASAPSTPLPRLLGNVCLYINGSPTPLLFVSPNQINAQLPFNVSSGTTMSITNSGGQSSPFNFSVDATGPAIFRMGNGSPIIVRTVDGKLITPSTPIHLNQILNIYMTGLGAVSPTVNAGDAAPSSPLAATTETPSIMLGATNLWTLWSGLAPGFVGVYQVNAQVPFHHVPTGSKVPLTITQGGHSTVIYVPVEE